MRSFAFMGRTALPALLTLALGVSLIFTTVSAADAATWKRCSKVEGDAAARSAGVAHALNRDRSLRHIFLDISPSSVYRRPSTSLCGDFDRDADTDRAVHYQCCTVSSPAPWVVLRRRGSRWRIAYQRLHDTTFKLQSSDMSLKTTEPKYASSDPLCCPSRLRIGWLRWTGARFKRSFQIQDASPA
jgi:hypothetical protein